MQHLQMGVRTQPMGRDSRRSLLGFGGHDVLRIRSLGVHLAF